MNGTGKINFKGVDMEVGYWHVECTNETHDLPSEGEFLIETLNVGGYDIMPILSDLTIEEITNQYIKENNIK